MHGLGYTAASWDRELDSSPPLAFASRPMAPPDPTVDAVPQEAAAASPERHCGNEGGGAKLSTGWLQKSLPWVKLAAKLVVAAWPRSKASAVLSALDPVVDAVATAADTGLGVKVTGREDVVYLDDSGSMNLDKISQGQSLWVDMSTLLQRNPTRVLKFGTDKHLIAPRSTEVSTAAVSANWDASSGTTYMWHMILEDIRGNYIPGPGRLRAFVITDGADTDSPPPYHGMRGMDPMMQELLRSGYDVEFHIVFVSGLAERAMQAFQTLPRDFGRYRDLAQATGGNFLHLRLGGPPEERSAFLARLGGGGTGAREDEELLRLEARRSYEARLGRGGAADFGWYRRLPPG